MPESVTPAAVNFATVANANAFLRLDAAARKISEPSWYEQAGESYPYLTWNAGTDGYWQYYVGIWEQFPPAAPNKPFTTPNHTISLSTHIFKNSGKAYSLELSAYRRQRDDWGATINFSTHDGLNGLYERFEFTLEHPQHAPRVEPGYRGPDGRLHLGVGRCYFNGDRKDDGDLGYEFNVNSWSPTDTTPRRLLRKEIRAYWASPESFRTMARTEFDQWEANLRKKLADGKVAVYSYKNGTSAKPRQAADIKTIPPEILAGILKDGLAKIDAQRKLVDEHHVAMHRGLVTTFPPLAEILAGE
ncbi:hypothetical protein [Anatilimnocola floriformis]|uniref:hypothetical protein n=1 Tax=Anatilimnocola floriformis TaxID=2948575 RepID=UPI0020C5B0DA|nr:hypothetical protein [Anatilimnocola floriformis]